MGFGAITEKTEGASGGVKKGRSARRLTFTMRTLVPKDPYWAMMLSDKESGVRVKGTL